LGHAAGFGVGAYISGYLALKIVNNFWLGLAGGLAVSSAVAAVFGFLALRTRGINFLMITLALSQILWGIATLWRAVTGGDDGLSGIPSPNLVFIPVDLSSTQTYYYFTLAFFVIAAIAMSLVVRSPFGLALKGIRDGETRMRALGYNIWVYQYVAFMIASFFASLAGILMVYYHGFVSPSDLHILMSAKVFLMVILGGSGTLVGPVIGAVSIVILENFVSAYTTRWMLILGLIYVLVISFAPRGIYNPIKERVLGWLIRQSR